MGFRSTITTEAVHLEVPQWFKDEYPYISYVTEVDGRSFFPLGSLAEFKAYSPHLPEAIQRILKEQKTTEYRMEEIVMVYLHECGGITRVEIREDSIVHTEPTGWKVTDGVEHSYCYGCSDAKLAGKVA